MANILTNLALVVFSTNDTTLQFVPTNPVEGTVLTNIEVMSRTTRVTNYVPYIYRSGNWLLLPTEVPKTVTTNWINPIKIFEGYWSVTSSNTFVKGAQTVVRCGITSDGQVVWELK